MVKRRMFKIASQFVLHPWFRLTRGMTLGVRAMVLDDNGRVLLVRHSYAPGWLFPGGGVERGETLAVSLERELHEEAAVRLTAPARLFAVYSNEAHFRGDHVALFVARKFERDHWTASREIVEARFFGRDELPEGTTGGTTRRLAEVLDGHPAAENW